MGIAILVFSDHDDEMTSLPCIGDRSLFPNLACRAYLAHAAVSPISGPVKSAMIDLIDDFATQGVGAFKSWLDQRVQLKLRLAELIGAESSGIGLVPNTSTGVSAIALCIPWQPQDRVVLFEGEFPANVTPWQRAAELFDLELVWVSPTRFSEDVDAGLAELRRALTPRARLIAVSAVQFQTGLRMPLDAIADLAREYGAELFVDAIQAAGAVPLDVGIGIDYLAAGGHKWLMGVEGAGCLYVDPAHVPRLRPNVAGWLSHEDAFRFLLDGPGHLRYDREIRVQADFVEGGTPSAVGYAALGASVGLIQKLGVSAIYQHVNRYLDRLELWLEVHGFRSLRTLFPEGRSTILSVVPPEPFDAITLARELGKRGVVVSTPDGLLRFAPHWPNSLDEVDIIIAALSEILH